MTQQNGLLEQGSDMILLAACALHDQLPDEQRLRAMDFDALFRLASLHSMQVIVYMTLEKCVAAYGDDWIDPVLRAKWRRSYMREMKRLLALEVERERLTCFLRENGISYLCLKGAVLQNYYRTVGMRQMSDNDILIDPAHAKRIRRYMSQQGYSTAGYGVGCHDIYQKDHLYFEIHRTLVADKGKRPEEQLAARYYKNVKAHLVPAENGIELRFTDEDFYVYFISHAYKHFYGRGYGVRFLMDVFVLTHALGDRICDRYVRGELESLGLSSFENMITALSERLFSHAAEMPQALDEQERQVLVYCLKSGTFGTYQTHVENSLHRMASGKRISFVMRARYFLRRTFPPLRYYWDKHPVLSKFIITIPFLWIARLIRGISKPHALATEMHYLKKTE